MYGFFLIARSWPVLISAEFLLKITPTTVPVSKLQIQNLYRMGNSSLIFNEIYQLSVDGGVSRIIQHGLVLGLHYHRDKYMNYKVNLVNYEINNHNHSSCNLKL